MTQDVKIRSLRLQISTKVNGMLLNRCGRQHTWVPQLNPIKMGNILSKRPYQPLTNYLLTNNNTIPATIKFKLIDDNNNISFLQLDQSEGYSNNLRAGPSHTHKDRRWTVRIYSVKCILQTSIRCCSILTIICNFHDKMWVIHHVNQRRLLSRIQHELAGQRNKFHPGVGRGSRGVSLTLSDFCFFWLHGEVFSQDGVDFTRHEGPRSVGICQRTLVTTRAVNLEQRTNVFFQHAQQQG